MSLRSTDASTPDDPRTIATRSHPHCLVCGRNDTMGLGLRFELQQDGSVECHFSGTAAFEGYPRQLHGGVIALLLDGAMTNCLFAHGHEAVTAELKIRYRHTVATERRAALRAWIERAHNRLHLIAAELVQDGQVKAVASAKFVDRRRSTGSPPAGSGDRVGTP